MDTPPDPGIESTRATQPMPGMAPREIADAPADARFGKFVRVAKVGAGAMGEVWRAWDVELSRWVALKFLKGGDDIELARFKREAQTAGNLSHPNIAAIHEVGEAQGRYFIAMQYIEGETLAKFRRDDLRLLVRLVRDAARAVAYAHAQGIVHRDLKPDNLMVTTRAGEHHVVVTDFGLARAVDRTSNLTASNVIMGTPQYMSPEQAGANRYDERSDVYSLGVTLYELTTGRVPFDGRTILDTLRRIQDEEPTPPRQLIRSFDSDLETVILKSIEKDPANRYATADMLAKDLTRWLDGEPIGARAADSWTRLRKSMVKRRGLLAGAGLVIAGIAVAAAMVVPQMRRDRMEREAAQRREGALRELGALWTQILVARQGLRMPSENAARVREKVEASIEAVSDFMRRHPAQPQGYYVRARGWITVDEPERAVEDLLQALRADESFAPAHLLLARARFMQYERDLYGDTSRTESRRRRSEPLLKEARDRLAKGTAAGDPKAWVERWGLSRTPEDDVSDTVVRAMDLWYLHDDKRAAILLLEDAHRRDPSEEYCNILGNFSDNEEQRIAWQTRALDRMPHYAKAYLDRGVTHLHLRHNDEALDDLTRAIGLNPRLAHAYVNRGTLRYGLGQVPAAIEDFSRAIELLPDQELAYVNRAVARMMSGELDTALADVKRAIELAPDYATAWAFRGVIRGQSGDLQGAIDDATQAMSLDPKLAGAPYNRAVARWSMAQRASAPRDLLLGAQADLVLAVSLAEPSWSLLPSAHAALARVREELKRLGE